jgi:hypothetical protein
MHLAFDIPLPADERRRITNKMCRDKSPPPTKGTEMKKKKVVRRAWSKEDVRTLKTMARDKLGVKKIAKALKRSPAATSVMAAKRGISLSTRG